MTPEGGIPKYTRKHKDIFSPCLKFGHAARVFFAGTPLDQRVPSDSESKLPHDQIPKRTAQSLHFKDRSAKLQCVET